MGPSHTEGHAPPARSLPARVGRGLRTALVAGFVCWHLFFLLLRNPLDLWARPFRAWCRERGWSERLDPWLGPADRATTRYAHFLGLQQGWAMFPPPLARSAPFLTARLEFTDGTQAEQRSENDRDPAAGYFRAGGWRQRRLEDCLVCPEDPANLRNHTDLPVWEAYARWSVRRWRAAHPDDARTVQQVVLLRRSVPFPAPGDDPRDYPAAALYPIATFGPDGRIR